MSYTELIKRISNFDHYREFKCPNCGHIQRVYVLLIEANCENCMTSVKLRGYGSIGTEIEDVIDTVLGWLGNGKDFELAMHRKRVIDREVDNEADDDVD